MGFFDELFGSRKNYNSKKNWPKRYRIVGSDKNSKGHETAFSKSTKEGNRTEGWHGKNYNNKKS